MNLIGGIDRPTSGNVMIDGKKIFDMSESALTIFRRRNIGIVYQFYNLIPNLTVDENIMLPCLLDNRKPDSQKLSKIVELTGLAQRRGYLPGELSGGQQQRVSVGRALINDPAFILADEPTGNLDSKAGRKIIELLTSANRTENQTLILITHDESIALQADRILTISDGRIIRDEVSRTMTTASAIALSAALLTAVVNLVASGNAMLAGFLGNNYGAYGNAYIPLLLIPALFLASLIIAMSVIVISNAFRMSANERISQFGTLKCVGATKKQIYKTIMYECALLCVAAIPLGIMLGYLLSFIGIGIINLYIDDLNVLARTMMKRVSLSLSFTFSPFALIVSLIISLGTVFSAATLPARKAMRISALDCLRNGGETDTPGHGRTRIALGTKKPIKYQLAQKNVSSNRKRMHSAVTAFSISIILFITMSGLKEIASGIQNYIYTDYGYTVMADYTATFRNTVNPKTGRRQQNCAYPIDSKTAEEITGQFAQYHGTDVFGSGQDYSTYVAILAPCQ